MALRTRVSNLERELQKKNTRPVPQVPIGSLPSAAVPLAPVQQGNEEQRAPAPTVRGSNADEQFMNWLTENWLLKLGALLLLIGFGWLATYAFLNGWIGAQGRIALGIGLGTLILVLGWWRMQKYPAQGSVFLVLGSTVILLTTYAAREIYDFFTPFSALVIMFFSTAFVALSSIVFNRKTLGIASVLLAGVAPFLTSSGSTDYVSLFLYLGVVAIGSVWVAFWRDHRDMVMATVVVYAAYSVPLCLSALGGSYVPEMPTLLLFAYGFAALIYVTATAGLLRHEGPAAHIDIMTAVGNALLLLLWIYSAASEEWQSLIVAAWTVVFIVGAFTILKATQRYESFYIYAAIGVGYLAAATAMELEGPALTIAFTLEAGTLSLLTFFLRGDVRLAQRLAFFLVGPIILSIPSLASSAWRQGVVHDDFFVLVIIAMVFFVLGLAYRRPARVLGDVDTRDTNIALMVIGSLYAGALIWLSLHAALVNDDTAVMLALAIYTVVGIGIYLEGVAKDYSVLRTYGGLILGTVVARLLLVDVWNMELTGRIVTFFVIGSLLMSTAFLGRGRDKNKTVTQSPTPSV